MICSMFMSHWPLHDSRAGQCALHWRTTCYITILYSMLHYTMLAYHWRKVQYNTLHDLTNEIKHSTMSYVALRGIVWWYLTMHHDTLRRDTTRHHATRYHMARYETKRGNAIQYNTTWYNMRSQNVRMCSQYNATKYNIMQSTIIQKTICEIELDTLFHMSPMQLKELMELI